MPGSLIIGVSVPRYLKKKVEKHCIRLYVFWIIRLYWILVHTKYFAWQNFTSDDVVKSHLKMFFAERDQEFFENGIMGMPES